MLRQGEAQVRMDLDTEKGDMGQRGPGKQRITGGGCGWRHGAEGCQGAWDAGAEGMPGSRVPGRGMGQGWETYECWRDGGVGWERPTRPERDRDGWAQGEPGTQGSGQMGRRAEKHRDVRAESARDPGMERGGGRWGTEMGRDRQTRTKTGRGREGEAEDDRDAQARETTPKRPHVPEPPRVQTMPAPLLQAASRAAPEHRCLRSPLVAAGSILPMKLYLHPVPSPACIPSLSQWHVPVARVLSTALDMLAKTQAASA